MLLFRRPVLPTPNTVNLLVLINRQIRIKSWTNLFILFLHCFHKRKQWRILNLKLIHYNMATEFIFTFVEFRSACSPYEINVSCLNLFLVERKKNLLYMFRKKCFQRFFILLLSFLLSIVIVKVQVSVKLRKTSFVILFSHFFTEEIFFLLNSIDNFLNG